MTNQFGLNCIEIKYKNEKVIIDYIINICIAELFH